MNILINFSTLKAGGGQNVALNFINSLFIDFPQEFETNNFFFIVAKGSAIEKTIRSRFDDKNIFVVSKNPFVRVISELTSCRVFIARNKIDIIYSYFGYSLYSIKIPQIIGSAVSNIYFPEINFWSQYKGISLFKKKIVDYYRIWGIRRATGIIFETELLEERFHKIYKFKAITRTIKPSIFVMNNTKEKLFSFKDYKVKKGLFLCGWQLNKNIMLIPQVASYLKKRNVPFLFVITAPLDNSFYHTEFIKLVHALNVEEYIYYTNTIKKDYLMSLYSQIDIVFLLSKLESFSNNIIESWTYKRLLVAANEEWAKYICKDASVYVDRDSVESIGNMIIDYVKDPSNYNETIERGQGLLKLYPSIKEKTQSELDFIKYVYEKAN